ncbi:uncharacterized protein [Mytilus edulis]|uniref:uncharacterized protein n=1 Tax=Mytilus edulis TaxID=6550 RepID=UPI0039EF1C04
MEKTRSNIELGNNRFVQATEWKEEIRIDIREWELKDGQRTPTKRGLGLPLHRWKMLVDSLDFLDQAIMEKREYKSHLGRNMYATIGPNSVCVDLRQHILPPQQTDVVPTRKGITLRPTEYAKLKDVARIISDFVPDLSTVVPCPYNSDHQNQLGFLTCSECNPNHCTE